jgi:hypothetical protein
MHCCLHSRHDAACRPRHLSRDVESALKSFDTCGDGLAGRIYRRALQERFAACPFTPAARTRYSTRLRAQGAKSRQAIENMIEQRGGLPVQLEGMNATCHAQQANEDYRRLRNQLQAYSAGSLPPTAILPSACDADAIGPGTAPQPSP